MNSKPGFTRWATFARRPEERLSRQTTWSPLATRRSHKCEPRNPAPPVTKARMPTPRVRVHRARWRCFDALYTTCEPTPRRVNGVACATGLTSGCCGGIRCAMGLRIAVLGTGYLGATHAACMADLGHDVLGLDVDEAKLAKLRSGDVPFYEPGLQEI